MKKAFSATITLFLVALISGCNNYSSPHGVLGSAYKAIETGKLKKFSRTFTSGFRKSHDMASLMAQLKSELDGFQHLTPSQQILTGHKLAEKRICRAMISMPMFQTVETERTYLVTIEGERSGLKAPVLTAEITCAVAFAERPVKLDLNSCYEEIGEVCRISGLN